MLYKKYHRDFVRKFKREVVVSIHSTGCNLKSPFIVFVICNRDILPYISAVILPFYFRTCNVTVVDWNGKLNIDNIDNVIQEISQKLC